MHNDRATGQFDKSHWDVNYPILQDYVDNVSYNKWIPAIEFQNASGSTTTMSTRNIMPVRVYQDGVENTAFAVIRRPRMWLNGVVSGRLYYTGDLVADTRATIALNFIPLSEGEAIPVEGTPDAQGRVTPTSDGVIMISRLDEVSSIATRRQEIDSTDDVCVVLVRRYGTGGFDDYTSDFELIGVELFYIEKAHPIGMSTHPTASRLGQRYLSKK